MGKTEPPVPLTVGSVTLIQPFCRLCQYLVKLSMSCEPQIPLLPLLQRNSLPGIEEDTCEDGNSLSPAVVLAAISVRHPLRTPRTSKTLVSAFPGGYCASVQSTNWTVAWTDLKMWWVKSYNSILSTIPFISIKNRHNTVFYIHIQKHTRMGGWVGGGAQLGCPTASPGLSFTERYLLVTHLSPTAANTEKEDFLEVWRIMT